MLRIRLSRTGSRKQPSYRVVVTDIEMKRDGRIVERIGHYNPRREPMEYRLEEDRALYWLSVGAQPSDAVRRLLDKQGTFDRLSRLRKGESLEALVAEYQGVDLVAEQPVAEEEAAEATTEDLVAEVESIVASEEEE
jgi:small subunit ribosomal protein S16